MSITTDSFTKRDVELLCKRMEQLFDEGFYPHLEIYREYSKHNPRLSGEMAHPKVFYWYLIRELYRLLKKGASVQLNKKRARIALDDPTLLSHMDEEEWDFTKKKLFLFSPERVDLSINRLLHYTGTLPELFQRYILFTNYNMHVKVFTEKFPDAVLPKSESVQMPTYHWIQPNNTGISLVNIGVGPSNAKTITDHVAVLRPDAMIMVGHCGGLRNHQHIGDFVLASGYYRDDRVLDDIFPIANPVIPNYLLNSYLKQALDKHGIEHRIGTVFTTTNRNWEFSANETVQKIHQSRSIAIDMESATVATNGFRYRVPHATLLSISDKPLHGKPKLSQQAQEFYNRSKKLHLELVLETIDAVKLNYPEGLPNSSIRSINEPLMDGV